MTRFEVTDTDHVVTTLMGLARARMSGKRLLLVADRRGHFERSDGSIRVR